MTNPVLKGSKRNCVHLTVICEVSRYVSIPSVPCGVAGLWWGSLNVVSLSGCLNTELLMGIVDGDISGPGHPWVSLVLGLVSVELYEIPHTSWVHQLKVSPMCHRKAADLLGLSVKPSSLERWLTSRMGISTCTEYL